jgi:hypothetical protein
MAPVNPNIGEFLKIIGCQLKNDLPYFFLNERSHSDMTLGIPFSSTTGDYLSIFGSQPTHLFALN